MEGKKRALAPLEDPGAGSAPGHERKEHPCEGCFHWRGWVWGSMCCNYIFDTGHRRPCEPGEDCTVKRPRGKPEWEEIREMQKLK